MSTVSADVEENVLLIAIFEVDVCSVSDQEFDEFQGLVVS